MNMNELFDFQRHLDETYSFLSHYNKHIDIDFIISLIIKSRFLKTLHDTSEKI